MDVDLEAAAAHQAWHDMHRRDERCPFCGGVGSLPAEPDHSPRPYRPTVTQEPQAKQAPAAAPEDFAVSDLVDLMPGNVDAFVDAYDRVFGPCDEFEE